MCDIREDSRPALGRLGRDVKVLDKRDRVGGEGEVLPLRPGRIASEIGVGGVQCGVVQRGLEEPPESDPGGLVLVRVEPLEGIELVLYRVRGRELDDVSPLVAAQSRVGEVLVEDEPEGIVVPLPQACYRVPREIK